MQRKSVLGAVAAASAAVLALSALRRLDPGRLIERQPNCPTCRWRRVSVRARVN